MNNRSGFLARVYDKLIAPIIAGDHSPEYGARGVLVGVLAALTPLVGVQMPLVLTWWALVKRFKPSWSFNVVVALAWVWTTNVFTAPPLYYLYVTTGRAILGRWDRIAQYDQFSSRLSAEVPEGATTLEILTAWADTLTSQFALPLAVGSIPWTLGGGALAYYITLRWLRHRQRRRSCPDAP